MVVLVVYIREVWTYLCHRFVPVPMPMLAAWCHRIIVLVVFVVALLVVMHPLFVGVPVLMVRCNQVPSAINIPAKGKARQPS